MNVIVASFEWTTSDAVGVIGILVYTIWFLRKVVSTWIKKRKT